MTTAVINIRTAGMVGAIYCGRNRDAEWRAEGAGGWWLHGRRIGPSSAGYFGNPVQVGTGSICVLCGRIHRRLHSPARACTARLLARRWAQDGEFRSAVISLHGHRLGCYCAPRWCHADLLAAAADGLAWCCGCGRGRLSSTVWLYDGLLHQCGRCYRGELAELQEAS